MDPEHVTKRAAYVDAIKAVGGAVSPLLTNWQKWILHFGEDHDFECLFGGVTTGFAGEFVEPSLEEVPFYDVRNYVPVSCTQLASDAIEKEVIAQRYVPVRKSFLRGHAALGVADKDKSNFQKIRLIHDLSRPFGTSTNDHTFYDKRVFASVKTACDLVRPG